MTQTVNHTFSNEAFIDEVIAECDGDMREAIKALLLVNEQLETELQQLYFRSNMARRANVACNVYFIDRSATDTCPQSVEAAIALERSRQLRLS